MRAAQQIVPEGLRLIIHRSKTDKVAGKVVVAVRIGSATCPVAAVEVRLSAAGIAAGSCVVAVAVAAAFGLQLRDPDGVAGPAYVRLPAVVALFVLSDVLPRSVQARRSPWRVLTEPCVATSWGVSFLRKPPSPA